MLVGIVVLVFLCLAFNGNSFWIDEGYSAYVASQHHFSDLVHALSRSDSGDLQTAGYYGYLWIWSHLFGISEMALRGSNVPPLLLLCFAFYWSSRKIFVSRFSWILCVLCPFFWVYVNESRVYLMLAALGSAAVATCLTSLTFQSERLRTSAALACLLLIWAGTVADVLMLFLIPGLVFLIWIRGAGLGSIWSVWRTAIVWTFPLYVAEAAYILWTLRQPQTMTYDNFRWLYVALFGYELTGLQGIGPSRNELRVLAPGFKLSTLIHGDLLLTACVGVLILGVLILLVSRKGKSGKLALQLFISGLISLGSLCLVSGILGERFLPRHAAAILPLFLYTLLALLSTSGTSSRLLLTLAATVVIGTVWIVSDLRLAFDKRYEKDNFRGATVEAIKLSALSENRVLWVGDYFTPGYYGLALEDWSSRLEPIIRPDVLEKATRWPVRGRGVYASNFSEPEIQRLLNQESGRQIYVVVTKLDLYDLQNAWRPFLYHHGEQIPFPFSPFALYRIRATETGN